MNAAAKSLQSCPTLCDPTDGSPPRLRCPWDSPGKNTGVGCHFLLQCMKLKSESEVAQSCLTLRDPMDCSLPVSSFCGIFQARILEWVAISFSNLTKEMKNLCMKIMKILLKKIEEDTPQNWKGILHSLEELTLLKITYI